MTTADDGNAAPSFRFKRRKTTHTKRARTDDEVTVSLDTQSPDAVTPPIAPEAAQDEDESVPNLKEIIRNRKRPRDRLKDVARRTEAPQTQLVQSEAPRPGQYTSRFIAQTGQVVDSSDKQMTVYVEARLAEQNYRQYGWPIPRHLQSTVAAIAPDLKHTFTLSATQATAASSTKDENIEHNSRVAAGQGKLQEVDLGSHAASRTHKDWKQLEGEMPAPKVRLGRDGKPRRGPKRRTSDDIRRDQMVEAVLHEAKLEFFDEAPVNPRFAGTDDDMVERFRTEYFESIEERQQRKPALPPGAKDQPKGPKLGGSRSARAAMRQQEELAAKTKR
ncbi:uncharacterized protein EKO05_0000607 [Ascochyta rabiei]|uniref:Uncharacterized protein n=1 Tax=Didymella rabiei TaxID=5454 RepID=A0A163HI08_DIDRA|nr:uncharacterized protein EKO05_0000607 [Ascochyta rabiei]KZM25298.1 hypothetical protein ST47_g3531 [Ascochyta rabiei]UPX09930.1 hypothetical protein EKO05_0000607 [Ascochyta rabiei]